MAAKKKKTKPAPKKPAKKPAKKAPRKAPKKATKKATKKAPKKAPKKAAVKKPAQASTAAPATTPSLEGKPAPGFALQGDDGQQHTLAAHRGKPVVVYFYPKDDTPGCTVEACGFRDNMARVTAKGAVVYGVSKDSLASHDKFKQKYNLNFTLLSDPELATHRAYGAWGEKVLYGQKTVGVIRSTFLIDKNGVVARAWPKVKVDGHVDAVLQALEAL